MAKSRKLEELLAELAQIRPQPTSETAIATLRQILNSKHSIAVAQAAKLIGTAELHQLQPELATTFDRLMKNPVETDPGCFAKKEIAETLYRLEYSEETLFLRGIRHIQMESVWGGKEDKAATLRGICGLGLVRMHYPLVMVELADLLADVDPEARIGAARAIAYTANPDNAPLLRLRIKVGDQPDVIVECLTALLKLAPDRSLDLAEACLYGYQPTDLTTNLTSNLTEAVQLAEAAALALGESRLPEAFTVLKDWWQQVRQPELRQSGLLAIAMLRQDKALEFLLALVAEGTSQNAKEAIEALSLYRQDQHLWQRVCQIVAQRDDAELKKLVVR